MKKYTKKNKFKYTAIIIEPRKHKALSFVLKNFLENLSSSWSIIVFHGNLNKEYVKNIIDKDLNKYKDRIKLKNLHLDNVTRGGYSKLLANKDFYKNIPTEVFMVFQTDTIIISKNKDRINDFLEYDYVGAPLFPTNYVGNGGLSLRRKSKMLEILEKIPYLKFFEESHFIDLEDLYFSLCFHYQLLANLYNVTINKPDSDKAKLFSSEYYFSPKSFGIHATWKYNDMKKLKRVDPDIEKLFNLQGIEQ